jgi:hypothetical protein
LSIGDPEVSVDTNPIQEAIRFDILTDVHDKLLKKYVELESIDDNRLFPLSTSQN